MNAENAGIKRSNVQKILFLAGWGVSKHSFKNRILMLAPEIHI